MICTARKLDNGFVSGAIKVAGEELTIEFKPSLLSGPDLIEALCHCISWWDAYDEAGPVPLTPEALAEIDLSLLHTIFLFIDSEPVRGLEVTPIGR